MIFKDGNSLEILPAVVQLFPQLNIMGYSMLPADVYEPVLHKLGVQYYLHKGSSQEQIEATLARFLFEPAPQRVAHPVSVSQANPFSQLSQRELEVLHYLLKGETIGQIATSLNLHKNTVSTLKARIFEKVDVLSYKDLLEKAAVHQITF
ncbi:hypothetical protein GCM10023184_29060 [Flaviaesturariibacter amylovorans]|uniref:HTH luxR-type domain-containing protein n=2 Tax=Flaviaesturariibacter amylovorans TaxID=1084520 RepID=A0ABP8H5S8_9BACT